MAVITYSQTAPLEGFRDWLLRQGLQNCLPQQQSGSQPVIDPELSADAWDNLALSVWSSKSGVTVRFLGEYQLRDGRVQHFSRDIIPTSDRAETSAILELPVSKLTSMTALLAVGSAQRGQVYVRAQKQRGLDAAATKLGTTLAGYVTNTYAPTFPAGPLEESFSGIGFQSTFAGTDPAAGAEVNEVVPTGAIWRLRGLRVTCVFAAVVASREVHLSLTDGTICLYVTPSGKTNTTGTTWNFQFADSGARYDGSISSNTVIPLPAWYLAPASTIETVTSNLQAGDNFADPHLSVEEWLAA